MLNSMGFSANVVGDVIPQPVYFIPIEDVDGNSDQLTYGADVGHSSQSFEYEELTSRNRGLISDEQQDALRQAVILVAGCGAIGGASIEPLVRAGAERFVLADNGSFAYEDASREPVRVQDVNRFKAEVFAERMRDVNPSGQFIVNTDGINEQNVASIVAGSNIVFDGISGSDADSLRAKLMLHLHAHRLQKPVVGGYDVAGTLWIPVYDYRVDETELLGGMVDESEVPDLQPVEFIWRLFSTLKIPIETIPEFERQLIGQSISPPSLGYTSLMFGAVAVRLTFDLLLNRPVNPNIVVDLPSLVRPKRERLKVAGRRLAMMYVVNNRLRDLRKKGRLGVYSPLDDEVFAGMREYMEERVWEAGSVIIRQGEEGTDFFVVVEGQVQVELEHDDAEREPDVIAKLGVGQYFGELALLTDQPRNASVVAATRCRVLSLSRGAFETYLAESSTAHRRLTEASASRRRDDVGQIG